MSLTLPFSSDNRSRSLVSMVPLEDVNDEAGGSALVVMLMVVVAVTSVLPVLQLAKCHVRMSSCSCILLASCNLQRYIWIRSVATATVVNAIVSI